MAGLIYKQIIIPVNANYLCVLSLYQWLNSICKINDLFLDFCDKFFYFFALKDDSFTYLLK